MAAPTGQRRKAGHLSGITALETACGRCHAAWHRRLVQWMDL